MIALRFFPVVSAVLSNVLIEARADASLPTGSFDWTGWTSHGGVAVSAPECVSAGAAIACFARGQDGQVWRRAFDRNDWQAWQRVPGVANASFYGSRPECTATNDRVDCFVRRHGDGALFRRTWAGGYMHSWENLGGALTSDPDCVAHAQTHIDCFARGDDSALWQNSFDGDTWSGWIWRGGNLAEQAKPACALRSAGRIECLVVWGDKSLRHFSVAAPRDGWTAVEGMVAELPSTENLTAAPKCYAAPDDARIDCFVPAAEVERHALMYLRYDGSWTVDDLSSDFGWEQAGPDRELIHYDFDCVVRPDNRFDCMELSAWRGYKGALAGEGRSVRFRHYSYVLGGPPAQWRNVQLTVPVRAGHMTFLKCLALDDVRLDCFTGGSWHGNATLNQASFAYSERSAFRPMKPIR